MKADSLSHSAVPSNAMDSFVSYFGPASSFLVVEFGVFRILTDVLVMRLVQDLRGVSVATQNRLNVFFVRGDIHLGSVFFA